MVRAGWLALPRRSVRGGIPEILFCFFFLILCIFTYLHFVGPNKRDFDELPDYVKQNMDAHFVNTYEEAYGIIFPKV